MPSAVAVIISCLGLWYHQTLEKKAVQSKVFQSSGIDL